MRSQARYISPGQAWTHKDGARLYPKDSKKTLKGPLERLSCVVRIDVEEGVSEAVKLDKSVRTCSTAGSERSLRPGWA